jgi:hypothetical protein
VKRSQHGAQFGGSVQQLRREGRLEVGEILGQENLIFEFRARPEAIRRNLAVSALRLRPTPSAMLQATETAARRIWLTRPYLSLSGKCAVV